MRLKLRNEPMPCPACSGLGKVPTMLIAFDETDKDGNRKMRERYDWMPCVACNGEDYAKRT